MAMLPELLRRKELLQLRFELRSAPAPSVQGVAGWARQAAPQSITRYAPRLGTNRFEGTAMTVGLTFYSTRNLAVLRGGCGERRGRLQSGSRARRAGIKAHRQVVVQVQLAVQRRRPRGARPLLLEAMRHERGCKNRPGAWLQSGITKCTPLERVQGAGWGIAPSSCASESGCLAHA